MCVRQTGERRVLFDVQKNGQKVAPKWVAPEEEQEPNESRRCVNLSTRDADCNIIERVHISLWSKLTQAIVAKDMEAATEAKTAVEESQRELRRQREESGEHFVPRFFQQDREGRWGPKFTCVTVPCYV